MNILIIGLGSIAKKHIAAIKKIDPVAQIYAIRSNLAAQSVDDVKNIYHYDELQHIDIDFAIISNPTIKHKETIDQLLAFKLPLFIEKPVSSSLDLDEIITQIEQAGILTYVACNLRFLDALKWTKTQLDSNKTKRLNEVNVYCGSYLPEWRPGSDYKKSYSANSSLGGGAHIDLIHEIDYLYWFFGTPNHVSRIFKKQSSLNIDSFDYANYVLEYNGFCSSVVLNYYRRDAKRSFELVFDDETWLVDLIQNKVMRNNEIVFESNQKIMDTYNLQMEYFLQCMEEKESFNTIQDGYNVLKLCVGYDIEK
jgi:predicted dehydrogenase